MRGRRIFIKKSSLMLAGASLFAGQLLADEKLTKITILHTNDMHSHIHPFKSGRNKGLGGMAQRASIIKQKRKESKHLLLLDAGDIFQGTPYFNLYGGELEFRLMSEIGYDAATLGNHDFDNGLNGLLTQLPYANFPFLCANYDFKDTILNNQFQPYKIFKKGKLKVGVFGIGIELDGLVPKTLYKETIYQDPIEKSTYYATLLKEKEDCDLIICLSHLGYKYRGKKISDVVLAEETKNIDLIIGGHTHTFLNQPVKKQNIIGKQVLITQAGWAGINIGQIDFYFGAKREIKKVHGSTYFIKNNENC